MAQPATEAAPPKVLRFLNDYRKKLSLLKIKSFYANHLCKKNCLESRLLTNNDTCLKSCDQWLDSYFELKAKKNPDEQEIVLLSSSEVEETQRAEYERGVARMRLSISDYISELQNFVDSKISLETKK